MTKEFQGYRIEIFPDKLQQKRMQVFFNAKNTAYNWGLSIQLNRLKSKAKLFNRKELTSMFVSETRNNPRYSFIGKEGISRHLFYYAFDDLNNTLHDYLTHKRAFATKRAGKPKFKSWKFSHKSFSQRNDMKLFNNHGQVQIAKLGIVKCAKGQRERVGVIEKPNDIVGIRFSTDGYRYWVSFNKRTTFKPLNDSCLSIGIDLGRKTWATDSVGINLVFPEKSVKNSIRKLGRLDKQLRRLTTGSRKFKEVSRKRHNVYQYLTNLTDDLIKKYVASLISMHPHQIVMENLAVSQMGRSRYFDHRLTFSKFRYFRDEVEYQSIRNGINFVLADRYYPSSQICSDCGFKHKVSWNERTYKCPNCGLEIDRDLNAAINLSNL